MEKTKWNYRLLKRVWAVYWAGFIVFLFFSRKPDFISGKTTEGTVIGIYERTYPSYDTGEGDVIYKNPMIYYYVDSVEYATYDARGFWLVPPEKGDKITVIYSPKDPHQVGFPWSIAYWWKWSELFIAFLIVAIITLCLTVIPHGYE